LPRETIVAATEISLSGGEAGGSVRLALDSAGEGWILPERGRLPVDFEKLSRFVRSLKEAELARLVTRNPSRLARLNLGASKVVFAEGDEVLREIQAGDAAEQGGRYVSFAAEEAAFLADGAVFVDTDWRNWYQKEPFDFELGEVASLQLLVRGGDEDPRAMRFLRSTPETDWVTAEPTPGRELDGADLERLARRLVQVRIRELLPAEDPEAQAALLPENSTIVRLKTFAEAEYVLRIGRRPAIDGVEQSGEELDEPTDEETATQQPEPATPAGPVVLAFASGPRDFGFIRPQEKYAYVVADRLGELFPVDDKEIFNEAAAAAAAQAPAAEATEEEPEAVDTAPNDRAGPPAQPAVEPDQAPKPEPEPGGA
jgi:hypothetical protein